MYFLFRAGLFRWKKIIGKLKLILEQWSRLDQGGNWWLTRLPEWKKNLPAHSTHSRLCCAPTCVREPHQGITNQNRKREPWPAHEESQDTYITDINWLLTKKTQKIISYKAYGPNKLSCEYQPSHMYNRGFDVSSTLDTSNVANTLMWISSFYHQVKLKHVSLI